MSHTPGPWKIYRQNEYITVRDSSGRGIAFFADNDQIRDANARFIVTACNTHDDLLAACKAFLAWLDNPPDDGLTEYSEMTALIGNIRTAIAKAEETDDPNAPD